MERGTVMRAGQANTGRLHFGRRLLAACMAGAMIAALPGPAFAEGAEYETHVHTESCYSIGRHLVCGLEENPGHHHSEACRAPVRGELLCPDITGDHVHGDACYAWSDELICGLEEGEGAHTHGEACYEEEKVLVCGYEDTAPLEEEAVSVETELPPEPDEAADAEAEENEDGAQTEEIIFGPGDGMSSALQWERELCFADVSDPTADVEDETDWWRMFCDMELSGNWAEDLVMVAESQLGYTESELNFSDEDPWNPHGYTRYGAWYGIPYGEWCAMFISFCMYYAEIPSDFVPYNCHCSEWVRELSERGMYRNWDEGYAPKRGDLIFFDFDQDEKAEHVGIITGIDDNRGWIYTIEGNRYNYVESFILTKYDYSIIGYGELPDNPFYNPWNPGVERQNGMVELPPEEPEPTPQTWDSIMDAAAGIKNVNINPTVEASRVVN